MQDSTAPVEPGPGRPAPVVFDVHSLWRRLAALHDRRQRRGKRYALPLVLLLVVLAKLSGEDRPSGIADWVKHRRAPLAQALEITRRLSEELRGQASTVGVLTGPRTLSSLFAAPPADLGARAVTIAAAGAASRAEEEA